MKNKLKFALFLAAVTLVYASNLTEKAERFPALTSLQLVSEAQAVMGRQRRTRRRGVAVGYAAGSASTAAAAKSQQAAAASQQQAAAAPAPAPAPAPGAPPIGSIATALPEGCATTAISGIQYFNCAGVYYRTAFQGNNLVYVVAQP